MRAGATASQVPAAVRAPATAQLVDDSASAYVALRDEVRRRRKWLRFAWARNQIWIDVAETLATAMPMAATSAAKGALTASARRKGAKTRDIAVMTAPVLARCARVAERGAEATRSGASSPEIASQARAPPSCPAAVTRTGTTRTDASRPVPKLRHNRNAGGTR